MSDSDISSGLGTDYSDDDDLYEDNSNEPFLTLVQRIFYPDDYKLQNTTIIEIVEKIALVQRLDYLYRTSELYTNIKDVQNDELANGESVSDFVFHNRGTLTSAIIAFKQ